MLQLLPRRPGGGRRPRHRQRRKARRVLTPFAVALALLVPASVALASVQSGTSGTSGTSATPNNEPGDDFYTPPSPLPSGQPGDVIRSRPAKNGPPPSQSLATAWEVMYLSTDALGNPDAVTGMVLVPKGVDPSTAPIIGFGPGTEGPAARCAPSGMVDRGAFYEQPALNDSLKAGYAVAMTDYEGYHANPKSTYIVGKSMGAALIDAVRAATRLPDAKLSKTAKVVFRGYSQGGGATMWAGQMQPTYAPELNLVAVAGGGVPADLVQEALTLEGKSGFGLMLNALVGLDNAYPDLKFGSYLNDAGKAAVSDMAANECVLELLTKYSGKHLSDYTTKSPLVDPAWVPRYNENKLGATAIKVPVFDYHATADPWVPYQPALALRNTYCSMGVNVTWKTWDSDHLHLVYWGNADVASFIADRLAGKPVTSNCPTS